MKLPDADRIRLARVQADSCQEVSRFDAARRHFLDCARLSGIVVPQSRLGLALSTAGECVEQTLRRFGLLPGSSKGAARERDKLAAHIHMRLAEHAYFASDSLGVIHGTLTSLNRAERVRSATETTVGYGGLAIGAGAAGLHPLARRYARRSVDLAHREGSIHDRGISNLVSAVYYFSSGTWQAAIAHLERGARQFRRIGDVSRQQSCEVILAFVHVARYDHARARGLLARFSPDFADIDNGPVLAWALSCRALLDMFANRPPEEILEGLRRLHRSQLNASEQVLCGTIEAHLMLQLGDRYQTLHRALAVLDLIEAHPPTMAGVYIGIPTMADLFLSLASDAQGAEREALLSSARRACAAARSFAAKAPIAWPRAHYAAARLASVAGNGISRDRGCGAARNPPRGSTCRSNIRCAIPHCAEIRRR